MVTTHSTQKLTFDAMLQEALSEDLAAGSCSLEHIARLLCLSPRTLQRRLSENGTTFRRELEATRLKVAQACIMDGRLSSEEIAARVGYKSTVSFMRAFKEWTGMTVGQYRKSQGSAARR